MAWRAERVAGTHTGFTPAALIRRRRLQDAADRLRHDPGANLAGLAHELGYADHAHLTRDFRTVLGFTPTTYRLGDSGRQTGRAAAAADAAAGSASTSRSSAASSWADETNQASNADGGG